MTQNSTSGFIRTEDQALLDVEALRMRGKGWSYQRIADNLGVAKSTARDRCERALAAVPVETVDEYRKIMDEQLDQILEPALQKALSGDKGALFAIDRVVVILDRKARLWGLDRAVKQQIEVTTYQGGGELERELQRLAEYHASLQGDSGAVLVGEEESPAEATTP